MPTKREISAAVLSSRSFEEGAVSSITPSMQRHLQLSTQTLSPQKAVKVSQSSALLDCGMGESGRHVHPPTIDRSQYAPSAYMAEMRLSTEERVSRLSRRNQPPPQIIEFMDLAATSHAKVCVCMRVLSVK